MLSNLNLKISSIASQIQSLTNVLEPVPLACRLTYSVCLMAECPLILNAYGTPRHFTVLKNSTIVYQSLPKKPFTGDI